VAEIILNNKEVVSDILVLRGFHKLINEIGCGSEWVYLRILRAPQSMRNGLEITNEFYIKSDCLVFGCFSFALAIFLFEQFLGTLNRLVHCFALSWNGNLKFKLRESHVDFNKNYICPCL